MRAVRITFGDPADRMAFMVDMGNFAASRREDEATFTAFDVETGKPALVKMRPHGERAVEIEVVRE